MALVRVKDRRSSAWGSALLGVFLAMAIGGPSCKSRQDKSLATSGESGKPEAPEASEVPSAKAASNLGTSSLPKRRAAEPAYELAQCSANPADPDAVMELASEQYRRGQFGQAHACAELATDLVPQAVEAQHLRAAALIGLERYDEAQIAFAMALVMDPDDPETLADVADFFINILPPKSRHTIEVGLQYARRGGQTALARRHRDRKLQGRLLLLEAEAWNDLGDPERALARVEEALALVPDLARAEHELAVSFFQLLRFEESERVFLKLLIGSPRDAYAHHHLGLIYERIGRVDDAEAHFQRARELDPEEFSPPVILSASDFALELGKAVAELPPELAALIKETKVEFSDLPFDADLRASSPPFTPTLLGLFRGEPVSARGQGASEDDVRTASARTILLYRKNLGRAVRSRAELNQQIRKTLRHEVGHLEGYDEDELRRLGLE